MLPKVKLELPAVGPTTPKTPDTVDEVAVVVPPEPAGKPTVPVLAREMLVPPDAPARSRKFTPFAAAL